MAFLVEIKFSDQEPEYKIFREAHKANEYMFFRLYFFLKDIPFERNFIMGVSLYKPSDFLITHKDVLDFFSLKPTPIKDFSRRDSVKLNDMVHAWKAYDKLKNIPEITNARN